MECKSEIINIYFNIIYSSNFNQPLMKKNYFLLLCSVLLSVSFFSTACSDDEVEPVVVPSFPELVTKTATAGEVISISFDANYDWVASISESTYTYFQLLTGEGANATTTKGISGTPGQHTIKVKVAEDIVFDNAPVGEVTLVMNGESKVIAKITYPTTARVVSVYAPQVNEWGAFVNGVYGGDFLYAYEENAMAADACVAMDWGVERMNDTDASSFYAPIKIESNCEYTIAGPEWMVAVEAGKIGAQEFIIKADATKLPADSKVETIDILVAGTETVITSFQVGITGYNDFIYFETYEVSEYDSNGKFTSLPYWASVLASENFKVVACTAEGEVDWIKFYVSKEGNDLLKNHTVQILSVDKNEGPERKAYVFFFAPNEIPADLTAMFDAEGKVKAEYEDCMASTIVQHATPATIEGTEVDEAAATFEEVDATFSDVWFFDDLRVTIGSKYALHYWGEWATDAHSYTYFTASRPIKSLTCYHYNDAGSLVEIPEDNQWVYAKTFGVEAEKVKFRIYCKDLNAIPESAKNPSTGDGEAVVKIEHTDGSFSAIYFHISAPNAGGSDGVAFENDMYAGMANATLVELKAGDELYDTWFAEFSSEAAPAKFYHLTYPWPLDTNMLPMVALKGIDPSLTVTNGEWASFDVETQAVIMEASGAGSSIPDAILFRNSSWVNEIVILCTLESAE